MSPEGECTLCHAKLRRSDFAKHLTDVHGDRNHVGAVIPRTKVGHYFRKKLTLLEVTESVRLTLGEHAAVRRLNDVHEKAHKTEKSNQLDDWAFVYGFFVGASIAPKRAHKFTRLYIYHEWGKDPIFAKSLA